MNETATMIDQPPQRWLPFLARLWSMREPGPPPAGDPRPAVVAMAAAWLAAWVLIDRWLSQPDPRFYADGIPLLAWYALAVLGLAAALRWRSRPAPAFDRALALAMGAVPVPLLFTGVATVYLDPRWFPGASTIVGIYTLLYLARGLRAITGETQRTAACAGLILIVGFAWVTDDLDVIPDVWTPAESQAAQAGDAPDDGEAILFAQAALIDARLDAVERGTSPKPLAFFLGFAGVGDQKVFTQEIGLASRVMGERYGIAGRSLSLINDQRDLERGPLATVSGLKYALRGLAARMNTDQDVLFLSISSHGAEGADIVVSNSQLPLNDLTDEDLADALRESGIKWRVIIISACYAGGFIDSLRDPQTIVIAAAAADRTSFGCSNDSDLTYFGEAFYRDALPGARSLRAAFDTAKSAIAVREHRERVTPSNPQAYFGAKLEAKLAAMTTTDP
jgi:Peptidase C13 family